MITIYCQWKFLSFSKAAFTFAYFLGKTFRLSKYSFIFLLLPKNLGNCGHMPIFFPRLYVIRWPIHTTFLRAKKRDILQCSIRVSRTFTEKMSRKMSENL